MPKVDRETLRLLKAVKAGTIRDPERVREILQDARVLIAGSRERQERIEALFFAAEQNFLHGWTPPDDRVEI